MKMLVRRKLLPALGLPAIVVALLVAGCGSSGGGSSSGSSNASNGSGGLTELKVIASGADTYPYNGMLAVAQDKGWFKQEGLKLTLVSSEQGGGGVAQVLASGGANLGIGGGSAAVPLAQQASSNIVLLANWYPVNDFVWAMPATSHAKLNGATLGFTSPGSSTELMLKGMAVAEPNVHFKTVAAGSPGAEWAAAKAGKITAGFELPPYTQQLQATEGAQILVAGKDVVGDMPADMVYGNRDWVKSHADTVRAFFRVVHKAFNYAATQPVPASKDLAKEIPVPAKYLQQAIQQYRGGYDLKTSPEALKNLSKILVDTKTVSAPVDWNKILDQQYLPPEDRSSLPASG